MTNRERILNCLHYQPYDRLPVLHFGFWGETLQNWYREGHLTKEEATTWGDGNPTDAMICKKLGFDSNYYLTFAPHHGLRPGFEGRVVEVMADGYRKVLNGDGVVVLVNDSANSIPSEIEHLLTNRESWEKHYLAKLVYSDERTTQSHVNAGGTILPFNQGGLEWLKDPSRRQDPIGLYCGSLFGMIRNWVGVVGSSYIYADDDKWGIWILRDPNAK